METCDRVVRALGTADIDARLEELLIDGILYAYQEQVRAGGSGAVWAGGSAPAARPLLPHRQEERGLRASAGIAPHQPGPLFPCLSQLADESPVVLNGFGTVINSLGQRAKPYLPQICGTIKWRLNNKSAKIRQQVRAGSGRGRRVSGPAAVGGAGRPPLPPSLVLPPALAPSQHASQTSVPFFPHAGGGPHLSHRARYGQV